MYKQRMYHFVIYQLSGIQAGIQSEHAVVEYIKTHWKDLDLQQWMNVDKTLIIKNGGTTNSVGYAAYSAEEYTGSLQDILHKLTDFGIKAEAFYEPDLNNAMTSIAFLVDERIWDVEKYPDFLTIPGVLLHPMDNRILEAEAKEKGFTRKHLEIRDYLNSFHLAKN